MARLGINTGSAPDAGDGDSLLAGAIKINSNFSEIYSAIGDGNVITNTIQQAGYATTAGIATYATNAGFSTSSGISTYATRSGIATYATNAGFSTSSGISTYATSSGIATYATNAGIATNAQGLTGTPNLNVGVVTATNVVIGGGTTQLVVNGDARITGILTVGSSSITFNGASNKITVGSGVTIDGNTGIISATSIVLNGTTITGAAVTYITAGSGISVDQNTGNVTITATGGGGSSQWVTTAAGIHTLSNVGIGTTNPTHTLTVKGNTSLETLNVSGVVTATSFVGSNTLKSRTVVSGTTTSIVNNGIGNTNITGFKSYSLMKVGLSTAAWIRLYTDSTSRTNDASRSQGIDPAPGSGVIAEVITTGISTTQIISPFVIGGNLDNPADTTIYAAITNLSGTTQAITANLTILQLEA